MNNRLEFKNNQSKPANAALTLKAGALRELEEALLNEEYERCAALIAAAKELSASQEEIGRLLKQAVSFLSALAPKKPLGRLRF
ncbi:MAG TPA: hypothetical protein VI749_08205 [Candidatus Omnitrophota bacterium]|nr:hypothetical protein [Candidatus Omnitrophota bacterium]